MMMVDYGKINYYSLMGYLKSSSAINVHTAGAPGPYELHIRNGKYGP
jgi:hypothetical protein